MTDITPYKNKLLELKAQQSYLQTKLAEMETTAQQIKELYEDALKARIVIQQVAKDTQQGVEFHISNLVTYAIQYVFDSSIEFKLVFVERRGQTECDFYFIKDGQQIEVMNANGGGLLDIASFALRIALWAMNKSRNTFIFDESFKFLSADKVPLAIDMIKDLCDKLEVQFIMVSHIEGFIDSADVGYVVKEGVCYERES